MNVFGGPVLQSRMSGRHNHFNLACLVAACAVIVSHVFQVTGHSGGIDPLTGWFRGQSLGAIAILVFFAVSGFFVTQSFAANPSVPRFLTARALRIFPGLATTLLATVLLGAILTTASAATFWPAAVHYFQSNLTIFLSAPALPGVFATKPNGPAANLSLWTLDHEVACYLWVALCGGLGLTGRPILMAVALVVMLIPYAAEVSAGVQLPVFRYAFAFAVGQTFRLLRSKIILSVEGPRRTRAGHDTGQSLIPPARPFSALASTPLSPRRNRAA